MHPVRFAPEHPGIRSPVSLNRPASDDRTGSPPGVAGGLRLPDRMPGNRWTSFVANPTVGLAHLLAVPTGVSQRWTVDDTGVAGFRTPPRGHASASRQRTGLVQAELVALDVLHHEARLVLVIGG